MIPTMILFGLVAGRWWKTALVAGTLGWPLLLFAEDIVHAPREVLGAAALGLVNSLAGVAVTQLAFRVIRATRKRAPAPGQQRASRTLLSLSLWLNVAVGAELPRTGPRSPCL